MLLPRLPALQQASAALAVDFDDRMGKRVTEQGKEKDGTVLPRQQWEFRRPQDANVVRVTQFFCFLSDLKSRCLDQDFHSLPDC
ncbi:unnamed protein product [Boreogadus saida]